MKRTNSAIVSMCAVGLLCAAGSAQVVISQVYGGGGNSGGQFRNDFIELKNIGNAPVNIGGWTVQRASAGTGGTTGNFTAGQSSTPFAANTILNPGQFYLVWCAAGTNANAPQLPTADHTATNMTMGAGDGKIALVNSNTIVSITDPAQFDQVTFNPIYGGGSPIVDFVGYGTNASHFEGSDGTLQLSNTLAAIRNGNGCTDTNDNFNDFGIGAPNPRNSATTLPCGVQTPDVTIAFSAATCNPVVNDAYDLTVTASNIDAANAADVIASVVLPPTLTYVGNSVGATYNSMTRTLSWTIGTLNGGGGSAQMTINTTVNAVGGLIAKAAISTTTPNDPPNGNTATSNNEVLSTAAPLSVIAIGSSSDSIATSVFEDVGGFPIERKLGTIYRVYTSPNGQWMIFRTDLQSLPAATNGAVIVGQLVGNAWQFSMVAREGTTAPIGTLPNAKIDNNEIGDIMGINNAGQYAYSAVLREDLEPNDTLTDVIVKGTVAGGISQVIAEGDAATATELSGRTYTGLSSVTMQNDGTVSFVATLSGTGTTNAALLTDNGATVLAQKGVTIPGNATTVIDFLDTDGSSDGRGLTVSADGTAWLATGEVQSANTTDDNVVIVNGTVAVREGSPVGAFAEPSGWATFGSQQVPWAHMLADGSWYIHGYNPASVGFNQGQDWVIRNGVLIASTGGPIFNSATESWNDAALQRTFFVAAGDGNNYVVGGLTDRALGANGSDNTTDGVIVYRGSQVVVREGAPVEIASGDTRYLNLISDNRSVVAGDKLYVTATLRNATSVCNQSFGNLPQAIVAVTLPVNNNPCPADIGQQGGEPGSDNTLDNNDFIVFIDYFFDQNPLADIGQQGGEPGSDSTFDNNDFIVFIDQFFTPC